MKKSKKAPRQLNIRTAFQLSMMFPLIILALMITIGTAFLLTYYFTQNRVFLFVLLGILFNLGVGYVLVIIFVFRWLYQIFYKGLYETTYNNLDSLSKDKTKLSLFPQNNIKEIQDLNNRIATVSTKLNNAFLVTYAPDYEKIHLDYVDKSKQLITFESFKANLSGLIFLSQSFRNVVVEVYYDLKEELTEESKTYLLDIYRKAFADYANSLFTFRDDNRSLLIYLPVIDSFSKIKEVLFYTIKESSVVTKTVQGTDNVPARYVVVAYPYSSEDSILSDLRYAKRQNKVVNFFLPNRTKNNVDERLMMHTSMNINYMSRLVSSLSGLDPVKYNAENDKEIIKDSLNGLSKYLDVDEAGVIVYDDTVRQYHPYVATDDSTLFAKNKNVSTDFVEVLSANTDDDCSYYFSKRNHANLTIGRMFDYYGINSGFYYAIKKNSQPIGLIYFFNRKKDFIIDAYLRESLFILSLRLDHYFSSMELMADIDLVKSESEYILSLGNHYIYNVDDNYRLTSFSNNLKSVFPHLKTGEPCYKQLFGLEHICHDCPMATFKKKRIDLKNKTYEISLTLNDRKSHNRYLLVEKIVGQEEYEPDLFNKDLLIYSFASLVNTLRDAYYSTSRGYLLLLSIDNYEQLLANQGSEGLLFVMRCFIKKIKDKLKTQDVYYYNPTTIAIVFPLIGHADVINRCEAIYEISKDHFFDDGSNDTLSVTYLPFAYPRGFPSADDFLRNVNDFYLSDKLERNKDFIYFYDQSISRSASKRAFMISVIENEFSGKMSQSVNLQPMVQASDRKIYGAEILLRINDVHRNVFFSAEEISRIALQENKTYLITESILNYVGALYKEYGPNVFKINGFKRVAINIDQTYLRNPKLIQSIIEIHKTNKFPNNFLSFEIPEEMIPDNLDKIRNFAKELADIHITFSCDRYSGKYVAVEQLKELGFKEIKIMKSIIDNIDKDPVKFNEVKSLVLAAKHVGLNISVVGVENEAQYRLLKELDNDMMMQGYYFYKPLTRSDFIASIISYNK